MEPDIRTGFARTPRPCRHPYFYGETPSFCLGEGRPGEIAGRQVSALASVPSFSLVNSHLLPLVLAVRMFGRMAR